MARIAGVDIPREKRVEIGLTYVYGIGRTSSNKILAEAGINPDTRVKDLTEDEVIKIREIIDKNYKVEGNYSVLMNGFYATTTYGRIEQIREFKDVKKSLIGGWKKAEQRKMAYTAAVWARIIRPQENCFLGIYITCDWCITNHISHVFFNIIANNFVLFFILLCLHILNHFLQNSRICMQQICRCEQTAYAESNQYDCDNRNTFACNCIRSNFFAVLFATKHIQRDCRYQDKYSDNCPNHNFLL